MQYLENHIGSLSALSIFCRNIPERVRCKIYKVKSPAADFGLCGGFYFFEKENRYVPDKMDLGKS